MNAAPPTPDSALLLALAAAWANANASFFKRALRAPVFELTSGTPQLGLWRLRSRTMSLDRDFVLRQPWGLVVEVLKHEMAHQYAHEVLGAVDETAHGPAFREVCRRHGFDATASGVPMALGVTPNPDEDRAMRRVQKLLALAGSGNRNEAESAMNAAQKLMLEHNLGTPPAGYVFRHLGTPTGRVQAFARDLANLLGKHFFVDCIWVGVYDVRQAANGTVLEIVGTPGNVEMAAYVYDYVLHAVEKLWSEHKKERGVYANRDRRIFLSGAIRGFEEKLAMQAKACAETGLVWVGDPGVQRFLRTRHPHIRTTTFSVRTGGAFADGKAKGRELVLHRPVAAEPSARGRLLT